MLNRTTNPEAFTDRDLLPSFPQPGSKSGTRDQLGFRSAFLLTFTVAAWAAACLTPVSAQELSLDLELSGPQDAKSETQSILLRPQNGELPEFSKVADAGDPLQDSRAAARKLASAEMQAGSVGEAELVQQRFPNGRVNIERWVAETADGDFVNHGTYVRYNEAGQVVVSGRFEMGKRIGDWSREVTAKEVQGLTRQSLQGFKEPFISKATFVGGKLNGDWSCSDANGKLVFVWSFENGERNGPSTDFNAKNEVVASIQYKSNLAHGPARVITAAGRSPEDIEFENGRMLQKVAQYYPDSKTTSKNRKQTQRALKSEDWFLVATPFNITSNNWERSEVAYQPTEQFAKIRHGRAVTFFPNGQRESEGQYEKGERTGVFVWWYPNGQQKTVGEYRNNVEEGRWDWWHENGIREATGTFASGVKVDQWSVWNPEGRLVKRAKAESAVRRTASASSSTENR